MANWTKMWLGEITLKFWLVFNSFSQLDAKFPREGNSLIKPIKIPFQDRLERKRKRWTFSNVSHSHLLCQQTRWDFCLLPSRRMETLTTQTMRERKTFQKNFLFAWGKNSRKRDEGSSRKVIKCWKILSLYKQWKWKSDFFLLFCSWQKLFSSSWMCLLFVFPSSNAKIFRHLPKRYSNVFGLA